MTRTCFKFELTLKFLQPKILDRSPEAKKILQLTVDPISFLRTPQTSAKSRKKFILSIFRLDEIYENYPTSQSISDSLGEKWNQKENKLLFKDFEQIQHLREHTLQHTLQCSLISLQDVRDLPKNARSLIINKKSFVRDPLSDVILNFIKLNLTN